jgi:beta-galactosidase
MRGARIQRAGKTSMTTMKGARWGAAILFLCACGGVTEGSGTVRPPGPSDPGSPADTTEVRTTQQLMDSWRFIKDDGLSDEEALASAGENWQTIRLPHTWNAHDAANFDARDYDRGLGWYWLELLTPRKGRRHWLEIGAASLVADVWLNGTKLGVHRGGFTQFRFDITDVLAVNGPNALLVKVDNRNPEQDTDPTAIDPLSGDFNKPGGLYRHVALVSTAEQTYFDLGDMGGPGVYAATRAISGGTATVDVRAKLRNDAKQGRDYTARVSLAETAGQIIASAARHLSLPPQENMEIHQELQVANAHVWQGTSDPYQYDLIAELVDGAGIVIDRVVQRFGIREIRFDVEQGFFLNGKHIRLHGVSIHQDFLEKSWAISESDVDLSLAIVKEIGANAIRLGHYPFSRYTLEKVSELGFITWAEKPNGTRTMLNRCSTTDVAPAYLANAKEQLQETIRQQYNHAAVVTWGIGNESTFGQVGCDERYDNVTPYLRALHAIAKEEDPHRPTVYSEFPHAVRRTGPFVTEGITDLFATNRYYLWYHEPFEELSPLLDQLHALAAGQPFALSEYGAGSSIEQHTDHPGGGLPEVHSADDEAPSSFQPEEYASYVHQQNYAVIEGKAYLFGAFVWNMFDFGSANRNEGGYHGVNTKGLVTFDRQTRKDAFFFYKANWSSEPVMYIAGRRHRDRPYAFADVKVYSNADSVTLSVNDAAVGTLTPARCPQRTCLFEKVRLTSGTNRIVATGNRGQNRIADSVEWSLNTTDVNIAAGFLRSGYVTSNGKRFGSDYFFIGGTGGQTEEGDAEGGLPTDLYGTDDPQLFKYFRRGDFSYEIPLADGHYEITLGFVEPNRDAKPGGRLFTVTANGRALLEEFDIRNEAGAPRKAITRTFGVDVSGGRLILDFDAERGEALISNISVANSPAGRNGGSLP